MKTIVFRFQTIELDIFRYSNSLFLNFFETCCSVLFTFKTPVMLNMISIFKKAGIRTSIFVDAEEKMVEGAKNCGADRIELYTESYAQNFIEGREYDKRTENASEQHHQHTDSIQCELPANSHAANPGQVDRELGSIAKPDECQH